MNNRLFSLFWVLEWDILSYINNMKMIDTNLYEYIFDTIWPLFDYIHVGPVEL